MEEYREHIGDGVYVRFDGCNIWLETDRGDEQGKIEIALEPEIFDNLVKNCVDDNAHAVFEKSRLQKRVSLLEDALSELVWQIADANKNDSWKQVLYAKATHYHDLAAAWRERGEADGS